MEIIIVSCTLIQSFHNYLLGHLYVSGTGNMGKNESGLLGVNILLEKDSCKQLTVSIFLAPLD